MIKRFKDLTRLVVISSALLLTSPLRAEPTRCMRDGVAHADGAAGSTNRWTSAAWFDAYYYWLDTYCTDGGDYPGENPPGNCYYVNGVPYCS